MGALSRLPRIATRPLLLIAATALLLAACGSDDDATDRQVAVSDAWSLATGAAQPNGAVYFTVLSVGADTLEQVSVPDSVADHAELHEAVTTATGATAMQQVESGVALEPGTAVSFTPGGMHVMLVDLTEPLVGGGTFEIKLEFAKADPITLPVAVVESAP